MDTPYLTHPSSLTAGFPITLPGVDSTLDDIVAGKRDRMEPTCLIDSVRPLAEKLQPGDIVEVEAEGGELAFYRGPRSSEDVVA